ncbi:MAG: acyl carrier protein [Rubrivivax sp.]
MSAPEPGSLAIIRAAIARFCHEVEPAHVLPEADLSELGVDSLSLAEMLFAVEDALGTRIIDMSKRPHTVGDLMELIEPYEQELQKISFD